MNPKISIIIPTYNRARYLEQTIESALSQDYDNYEVIVSDNASTDNTVDVIQKYLNNDKFRYYRNETNIGMVKNWHKALHAYCRGDWFLILSDDDYFIDNTYLSQAVLLIKKDKKVCLVYANGYIKYESTGQMESLDLEFDEISDGKKIFLSRGTIRPQDFILCNVLFNRKLSLKFNPFENKYNIGCDSELFLLLCLIGKVAVVHSFVSVYRVHASNLIKQTDCSWEIFSNIGEHLIRPYRYAALNELLTLPQLRHFEMCILTPYLNNQLIAARLLFRDKEAAFIALVNLINKEMTYPVKKKLKFKIKYFIANYPVIYRTLQRFVDCCCTVDKFMHRLCGYVKKSLYVCRKNGFLRLTSIINFKLVCIKEKIIQRNYIDFLGDGMDGNTTMETIVLLTHNCSRTGAPLVVLNIARKIKKDFNKNIIFISLVGGDLADEFESVGSLLILNLSQEMIIKNQKIDKLFNFLKQNMINTVISNSVVTGVFAYYLDKYDFQFVNLIHELPHTIVESNFLDSAYCINKYSRKLIFPSATVRDKYNLFFRQQNFKSYIHPQGINFKNRFFNKKKDALELFYLKYGISGNDKVVLGSGNGFKRKGVDIFFKVADLVLKKEKNIHFVWFGEKESPLFLDLENMIKAKGYNKNIKFISPLKDPSLVFARADVFLLTSRDDPFPTVVLDEMDAGVPVVVFKGSGGIFEILQDNCGIVINDGFNHKKMANTVLELLHDSELYNLIRTNAKKRILEKCNYSTYTKFILDVVCENKK